MKIGVPREIKPQENRIGLTPESIKTLTLNGHDLRAAEKNLQLYHQLSGRAGRTGKSATVYFQTYNIKSDVISQITNVNPDIFLEKELLLRKRNNLPPFERFISIILSAKNESNIESSAY